MLKKLSRLAGGCLVWTGAQGSDGYGVVRWNESLWRPARLWWTLNVGELNDDIVLDHDGKRGCGNRACVEVKHLEAVTQEVNSRRPRRSNERRLREIVVSAKVSFLAVGYDRFLQKDIEGYVRDWLQRNEFFGGHPFVVESEMREAAPL